MTPDRYNDPLDIKDVKKTEEKRKIQQSKSELTVSGK